jgi:RNase_H superfamily
MSHPGNRSLRWFGARAEALLDVYAAYGAGPRGARELSKRLGETITEDAFYCAARRLRGKQPARPEQTPGGLVSETEPESETPKTLTVDIETAPLKSYHWGMWKENINPDLVQVDWSILAYAAKWLGREEILYSDTSGGGPNRVRDDSRLCRELWTLLDKADIVVTQNGKRFDIPRINARLIERGYGPYSPIKQVDTKVVAKSQFAFSSNRLAWLSKKLTTEPKSEHEKFPGFDLWEECLKDNPEAWAEMKKYNVQDVIATEAVYLKMRPWTVGHPNVANYKASEAIMCPKCSSTKMQKSGLWLTQSGEYTRYHCLACGGWSRTRYTENDLEKRRSLLSQ